MEIVKGILMGCGVLALLSMASCVGLVGVGSYAVDQALEESGEFEEARNQRGGKEGEGFDEGYYGDRENSGWGDDSL